MSLGDFDASAIVYRKFTTFRASSGAPFTLGGTPAISVYKDNSTTQSTAGVTLTVDFDGVAGLNHVAIDTSADGTFYSAGSFFDIVITTGTVDSVSVVGAVIDDFSLRKTAALKPTTAGRTLDVSAGGEAGLDWANIGSPTTVNNLSGTTIGIVTTINGLAQTAIANFFNVNSLTNYGAAVAGSVVKEIADNAGGSSLTVPLIVDGVWNATMASYVSAGSTGFTLNAAGSGGSSITVEQIWSAALPSTYNIGEAGYILGTLSNRSSCCPPRARTTLTGNTLPGRVYVKTAGDIIEEALRDAKIIPAEQPVTDNDYKNGLNALNNVSTFWQTQGLHLWLQERAILPLQAGQQVYSLGPNGDPCGYESSFTDTTLDADAVATDTAIVVASTLGMEQAPNLLTTSPVISVQDWTEFDSAVLTVNAGIRITNGAAASGGASYDLDAVIGETYRVRVNFVLGTSVSCLLTVDNGGLVADSVTATASGLYELEITAQLDTITFRAENTSAVITEYSTIGGLNYVNDADGSYIGIGLDDGIMFWTHVLNVNSLTDIDLAEPLPGDATSGNQVFNYGEQIDKPLQIFNVTYVSQPGQSEIPVSRWSRQEYMQQPVKNSQGTVVNYYYVPYIDHGKIYAWQTANNYQNMMILDIRRPMAVYDAISDELDVPTEYYLSLKWSLAAELGPSYGVIPEDQMVLEQKAADFLEKSLDADNELSSVSMGPDYMGRH